MSAAKRVADEMDGVLCELLFVPTLSSPSSQSPSESRLDIPFVSRT